LRLDLGLETFRDQFFHGLCLVGSGLGLVGPGLGLVGPGLDLGLVGPGLVNIPALRTRVDKNLNKVF